MMLGESQGLGDSRGRGAGGCPRGRVEVTVPRVEETPRKWRGLAQEPGWAPVYPGPVMCLPGPTDAETEVYVTYLR